MSVTLGHNQYGKAETHGVRIYPDTKTVNAFADKHGDAAEGAVHNADAPAPGLAFHPGQGW